MWHLFLITMRKRCHIFNNNTEASTTEEKAAMYKVEMDREAKIA